MWYIIHVCVCWFFFKFLNVGVNRHRGSVLFALKCWVIGKPIWSICTSCFAYLTDGQTRGHTSFLLFLCVCAHKYSSRPRDASAAASVAVATGWFCRWRCAVAKNKLFLNSSTHRSNDALSGFPRGVHDLPFFLPHTPTHSYTVTVTPLPIAHWLALCKNQQQQREQQPKCPGNNDKS